MELKLVKNTEELALMEVVFEDAIDRMSHQGFSGHEKYIKMTKGANHQITVYDKDSKVLNSFGFGSSGYTIVSADTGCLRDKVTAFLLRERIQMKKRGTEIERELKIMPPTPGLGIKGQFCIHLGDNFAAFLPSEEAIREMFGEYQIYKKEKAVTGVMVHYATLL